MNKALTISILIHLVIFLILWKIAVNLTTTVKQEKMFEVSMVTADEYNNLMTKSGYTTVNKNMDLPESKITSEDVIREDEMESTELSDVKREVIPTNILEPQKTNAILPGIGKELTTISNNTGSENNFYKLSGIVTTRRITIKYLPKYPKGYHINTDVVLNISVDEKGNIISATVAKKGGAPFDEISIKAAEKWKFEPLPSSGIQKGKLTFFYRLK